VIPGTLVHRATYGGGLAAFAGQPMAFGRMARAANAIRRDALQDPRLQDVSVAVSVETRAGSPYLQAEITARPRGDTAATALTVEA
jgi:predicted component of type VI protein secretion system